MREIYCWITGNHIWDMVFCSKDYQKSLYVCRRCGKSWWNTKEIGRFWESIHKKELA